MRRRAFLRAALLAPALAASGCRLTLEQGFMSACRSGIEPAATQWVEEAWRGLRPERVWDMHAHLFGNGRSGAGIRVEPELDRPKTIAGRARHAFFRNGGCLGEDEERFDQEMVARLARLANEFPPGARIMLMAFDAAHDASGARRDDLSSFVVPNDYARRIAAQYPERFEWIASVHPGRPDALEELARAHAGGARAVKWLPPSMAIDLASPRCVPFYEALRRLDLPLITHAGEEQAAPGAAHDHAGNPLLLRHPLERGVRVVAAHCATLGESPDIERVKDPAKAPRVPNFELFARLMAERRYEGLLFGDISAIAQVNRADYVGSILARREWAGRLLNGSDYPLPGILPLFSPARLVADGLLDERAVPALRSLRESNALLFDFVLKRNLRLGGEPLPASAFETRDFFDRGRSRVAAGSEQGQSRVRAGSEQGQSRVRAGSEQGQSRVLMSDHSQFRLLAQRRFAPLFWTQFLGAANDNLFKFAFTLLATYQAAQWGGGDGATAGFVIGAIFIAPFLLFSATSGQLADKLERSGLMRFVKNLEIAVMAIAAAGFLQKSAPLLYVSVFLMGLHSTLFGPVKYAYLPQHLKDAELTGGNGLVEMGTFVAILLGTMAAGLLVKAGPSGASYVAAACIAVAVAGRIVAHFIPHSPAPDPTLAINWNPFSETWRNLKVAARDTSVFHSLLGISWLWFFGSIFLTAITPFARDVLGGDENVVTLLLAVFSVGIGLGALACERLSGRKVEIGLVPFGSIGMTVFAVDLWLASRSLAPQGLSDVAVFLRDSAHWRVMADLFLLAFFGGLYSVPLYAVIQARAEPTHRARIIAANNIMNALFMIVAALMAKGLLDAGLTLPQLFLVVGLMNAAVAGYIYTLVPEFLMRFICWLLIHTVYRLEKRGLENIPEEGPAVVVANHVSFVDALVILAASPRPIRFVMDHRIFRIPILSFVFRTGKAIPIAPAKEDEALLNAAYEEVARALEQGELVGIFPEGRITDTGDLYPFRGGIRRIVERTPVPVVPLALKGLWGSYFSRRGGAAMTRPFRRGVWSRIGLEAAAPLAPAAATPEALQEAVLALRGDWR